MKLRGVSGPAPAQGSVCILQALFLASCTPLSGHMAREWQDQSAQALEFIKYIHSTVQKNLKSCAFVHYFECNLL